MCKNGEKPLCIRYLFIEMRIVDVDSLKKIVKEAIDEKRDFLEYIAGYLLKNP